MFGMRAQLQRSPPVSSFGSPLHGSPPLPRCRRKSRAWGFLDLAVRQGRRSWAQLQARQPQLPKAICERRLVGAGTPLWAMVVMGDGELHPAKGL